MRILLIGASGTIGQAVARALAGHEVVAASRHGAERVDITDPASLRALLARVGQVDAIVGVAGGGVWKPLDQLTDDDFAASLRDKLMGQVNLVRYGFDAVHGIYTRQITTLLRVAGGATVVLIALAIALMSCRSARRRAQA